MKSRRILSQCTFWCSVLSDLSRRRSRSRPQFRSQCTFWCSVLSDSFLGGVDASLRPVSMHLLVLSAFRHGLEGPWGLPVLGLNAPFGAQCFPTRRRMGARSRPMARLNAPFGAQCFPTLRRESLAGWDRGVSMHLLVLSAFRRVDGCLDDAALAVSMHLLVLSAFRRCTAQATTPPSLRLNAPFGAQCFPTLQDGTVRRRLDTVSMHLLVLSAFRREPSGWATSRSKRLNAPFGAQCFPTELIQWIREELLDGSQCTFWCSVLSDMTRDPSKPSHLRSQCTFWCSVLSDRAGGASLVAPLLVSQCTFWCSVLSDQKKRAHARLLELAVSMHLLVLSAFRRKAILVYVKRSRVSMHLLVLSAFRQHHGTGPRGHVPVSMHLLVLSAFRPFNVVDTSVSTTCLNAPFGAQCFPTPWPTPLAGGSLSLNAPFGAQCFPTRVRGGALTWIGVSMHLLVLSAFRHDETGVWCKARPGLNAPFGAQCFPTRGTAFTRPSARSQCTFWCSVLSDETVAECGE